MHEQYQPRLKSLEQQIARKEALLKEHEGDQERVARLQRELDALQAKRDLLLQIDIPVRGETVAQIDAQLDRKYGLLDRFGNLHGNAARLEQEIAALKMLRRVVGPWEPSESDEAE